MGDTLKSILFTVVAIAVLFLIGYWAFSSIESGSDHVKNQEIQRLKDENEELKKQIASLTTENSLLNSEKEELVLNTETTQPEVQVEKTPEVSETTSTTSKYQDLIDGLQNLVNKGVILEEKSQGPSVGLIQKFLNIYNNTSYRIDNDFGAKTEIAIKDFQKDMGLTADGGVGPTTIKKMISWLEK